MHDDESSALAAGAVAGTTALSAPIAARSAAMRFMLQTPYPSPLPRGDSKEQRRGI